MRRKQKNWIVFGFAALILGSGILTTPAQAQYPMVGNLTAFSAEAGYMSLAGCLRYRVFLQEKTWISRSEAERIVAQQMGR